MIAPHFERLAKEHSRPKKVAFAKINVDSQSTIARSNGVAAMPTFKIFHGGNCIETIKGANPPALTEAVSKALKLGDAAGKPGNVFKTPGRTLGGEAPRPGAAGIARSLDINGMLNALISLVGLYFVSLLSACCSIGLPREYDILTRLQFDSYKAAESSRFNIHRPQPVAGPGGPKASTSTNSTRPAQRPAFKTLADLGSE